MLCFVRIIGDPLSKSKKNLMVDSEQVLWGKGEKFNCDYENWNLILTICWSFIF